MKKRTFLMPLVTVLAGLLGSAAAVPAKPVTEAPTVREATLPQPVAPSKAQPADLVIKRSTDKAKFAQHRSHSSHSSHRSHYSSR